MDQDNDSGASAFDVSLRALTTTDRFNRLNRLEAYYRCQQYDHLRYDWNGNFITADEDPSIQPGFVVALAKRKPSVRVELARVITRRLTSFLFGADQWPALSVPDDILADDYVRELCRASRLQSKLVQGRNLGGAMGTACFSFAFVRGMPRVRVHNAKNISVTAWADPDLYRPAQVIEAYRYRRPIAVDGEFRDKDFFYVRYWDEEREVVWDPIPEEIGNKPGWATAVPSREVLHGYGFCPFYWIQNLPNDESADGESDYAVLTDDIDEINRLVSATNKGTVVNVDPTLVIKMEPRGNLGTVRKGSNNAIFSPGGAEYLEISGDSVRASMELYKELRSTVLESAQVVLPDPASIVARKDLSGEALRILYAPMLAQCDLLRDQYGPFAIEAMLTDMLEASRMVQANPVAVDDGEAKVVRMNLRPRIEKIEAEDGSIERVVAVERDPGESSNLELKWGTYFPNTWADVGKGMSAAQAAAGGKPVVSHRTAVSMASALAQVDDVEEELRQIEADSEFALDQAQRAFASNAEFGGADDASDSDADVDNDEP